MQSVPISAKAVSSNPAHDKVYSIQHYIIKFVNDLRHVWFSSSSPFSSTNKTNRHYIPDFFL